jgi:hypothetical protein
MTIPPATDTIVAYWLLLSQANKLGAVNCVEEPQSSAGVFSAVDAVPRDLRRM